MTIIDDPAYDRSTMVRPPKLNRLFAAGADADYSKHTATYGNFEAASTKTDLVDLLQEAGLTGRGGAGFDTWRKLAATRDARSGRLFGAGPVLIANGAEGEPRSIKDSTLLRHAPHLIIDGLLAAAAALRASQVHIYVEPASIPGVSAALAQRADASRIVLTEAAETFISGEASAVVNAIENGVALPQDRIRRLSESGLKRRPTLVQNVETFAHIALIARYGASWFRSVGTPRDPGTRLVTVSGDVQHETVLEVAGDTPLREVLRHFDAERTVIAAVLVGGYHGSWIPANQLELPLSADGLAPVGGHPGAGVIFVLGRHRCGLQATAEIVEYLAQQSARQCGPCMFGLPAMADLLTRIATGSRDPTLVTELRRLSDSVAGRGSCHHPDGTSRLVLSALWAFSADVTQHLSGRCLRARARR